MPDVEAQVGHHRTEDHEDEQRRGHVEQRDQRSEAGQRGHAVLADRVGHRAEGAQRCELHDVVQDLEDDLGEPVDHVQDRAADVADGVECDTEEHGQEDDLQDVALDERADHAVGDEVGDELPPLLGLAGW